MKKKILLPVGIVAVTLIIAIVCVVRLRAPDFSGSYRLKMGEKVTETVMTISLNGSSYIVRINGEKNLHASYTVKKPALNNLVITDESGGNKTSQYELRHTNRGLEGKVWVLPVGEVDVFFEKIPE